MLSQVEFYEAVGRVAALTASPNHDDKKLDCAHAMSNPPIDSDEFQVALEGILELIISRPNKPAHEAIR